MSEANKILLAGLIAVRDAGGNARHGICCAVDVKVRDMIPTYDMLGKLFVEWPKFSGNTASQLKAIGWLTTLHASLPHCGTAIQSMVSCVGNCWSG